MCIRDSHRTLWGKAHFFEFATVEFVEMGLSPKCRMVGFVRSGHKYFFVHIPFFVCLFFTFNRVQLSCFICILFYLSFILFFALIFFPFSILGIEFNYVVSFFMFIIFYFIWFKVCFLNFFSVLIFDSLFCVSVKCNFRFVRLVWWRCDF